MDKEKNVFSKEYAIESGTDFPSEPEEYAIESSTDFPIEPIEKKKQRQTVAGEIGYYDKSKPYRDFIKAKVIK